MATSKRPLTKIMIAKLRNCFEKISKSGGTIPCLQEDLKGSMGALYKRGLIDTKMQQVHGKPMLCVFVTKAGIDYLNNIDKNYPDNSKIDLHS